MIYWLHYFPLTPYPLPPMDASHLIAQIIGLLYLVVGIGVVVDGFTVLEDDVGGDI